MAISPNQDKYKDEAKPLLNFLRNAKSVTYEIVDVNKKVIRRLLEEKKVRKDIFNKSKRRYSFHTITNANWDGTIFNLKTGKNEVVPDGQYQMKIVATAEVTNTHPQEIYLPIKVDTKEPTIKQVVFENTSTTSSLRVNLTDELSGVDLRSVTVAINGKVESYDLSNQTAGSVSIPLVKSQQPMNGQNQVEIIITDQAGNNGYQRKLIQYGETSDLVLFNLTENQVITTNTTNFSVENHKLSIKGTYPNDLFINGIKATIDNVIFEATVPITNDTKTIIFSTDCEGKSIIKKVPIRVYSQAPTLSITDPIEGEIKIDNFTYILSGLTGETVKKLEVSRSDENHKVDLTSIVQKNGQFQTEIQLEHGQNLISIYATDEHDNQTVEKRIITTTNYQQKDMLVLENLNTSNYTIVGLGNPDYDASTEMYLVKGRLREKVDHFTINKQEVPYDPDTLTFKFPIQLKQGKHSLAFYIQTDQKNNGYPIVNEGFQVYVDTVLPTLQIDNLIVNENNEYTVYTNESPFHLKGVITDNFSDYRLFINNENIYTNIDYGIFDERFFEGKEANGFDYEVPVMTGENLVQIDLVDTVGNTTSKSVKVIYNNELPESPLVTANYTNLTNKAVRLKAIVEEDTSIFYSFDEDHYEPYTEEVSVVSNQKLYFYALDKFGNKSSITTFDVGNMQNEIAARPLINVKPKAHTLIELPPALVTIVYDKELTEEQKSYTHLRYSLDKGETYQTYTDSFGQEKETEVWAQSFDDAGNESEIIKLAITFSEPTEPTELNQMLIDKVVSTNRFNGIYPIYDTKNLEEKQLSEQNFDSTLLTNNTRLNQAKVASALLPKARERKNDKEVIVGWGILFLLIGYYNERRRKVKEHEK